MSIVGLALPALAEQKVELKDSQDKVSYSIGLDIGMTLKRQNIDIKPDVLIAGLKDAVSGAKPQMTEAQIKETMSAFQKEMMAKQTAVMKEAAEKNKAEGDKFLAENKAKAGVKTTADGLQYKVLKEGSGAMPKASDTVVVNYRGTLIDGTEFDSSYKRNEPATFPVSGVIKGWTEGLQLMKVGSKYQFVIPSSLAYGEQGASQEIGPNKTLVFEVELMDIKKAEAPASPSAASSPSASPAK